jgi:hypothetical protein
MSDVIRDFGIGGHPFGKDAGIAHERHTGRIGGFVGNGHAVQR